jgi:transmembrane sensor
MSETRDHLILAYLQGNLSPDETDAFEAWRNESEDNGRAVEEYQKIWQLTKIKEANNNFQSEREWQRLESSLSVEETPAHQLAPIRRSWLKIAATVLLVLASSSVLYLILSKSEERVIETFNSSHHEILPDGSEVWLNENSRLIYQENFTDERTLYLMGEAFFDVRENPNKPFVIQTESSQVKVLGTSFNVKSYPNEIQDEVFVATGRVSLNSIKSAQVVVLTPGATGILTKSDGRLITETDHDLNTLAWKERELVFRKTPLSAVLKTLNTYFKKEIQVENDSLLHCKFTGTFKNPTLPEVFETLGLALDLEITQRQGSYILSGVGCKPD